MQKYKEELDRFQLNEQQLQSLKTALSKQEEKQMRRPRSKVMAICATFILCLCVLSVLRLQLSSELAWLDLSQMQGTFVNGIQKLMGYKPIYYDYLVGFGYHEQNGILKSDTKGEVGNTYPKMDSLPVYRYREYKDNLGHTYPYRDETYRAKLEEVKQILSLEGEIQKSITGQYFLENKQVYVKVEEDASVILQFKESIPASILHNSDRILDYAKQYRDLYTKLADITSAMYHVTENAGGNYEIIITQKSEKAPIYEEGKASISFSIVGSSSSFHQDEETTYVAQIRFYDVDQLIYLKDMPLISVEEAKAILLKGGYYYAFQNTEFNENEIVGYDMVYPHDESMITFLPYRLPVYRFYIQKENGIYRFDVIAIQQEALATLTDRKTPWYFEDPILKIT